MPVYKYYCDKCGKYTKKVARIAERHEQTCDECGCELELAVPDRVFTILDIDPYFDTGFGCRVDSRQHKKRIMRERNLVDVRDYPSHNVDEWVDETQEKARKMVEKEKRCAEANC